MRKADEKLKAALEGYSNFLREKKLTLPKHQPHQPHLVRWVREFLIFHQALANPAGNGCRPHLSLSVSS